MHIGTIPSVSFHPAAVHGIAVHGIGKAAKLPIPKLASIHIQPMSNGVKVAHHYSGVAKTKQFVFTNPELMEKHIKRAVTNEWLTPTAGAGGEAKKIDKALNL